MGRGQKDHKRERESERRKDEMLSSREDG